MKLTKLAAVAVVAAVALAYNAKAVVVTFPLVKLAISGTVSYNTTNSPAHNGTNTTISVLTTVKINTKSLIGLLNASPTVTNTLLDVTGTSQIPAGSYFVYDLDNENLIITNLSGYNFTLRGYDSVTATDYTYGYLNIDALHLIGSYKQNDTTGAGRESDLTGIYFNFTDSNGNQLEDYGNGSLKWSFGKVANGVQKTTLSVNFPAPNGYNDMVNDNSAIAQNVKCSGKGTGNVESGIFPFYLSWED
ncbi:MAG: hypothetical protein ACLP2Y_12505 [Limisphaerales bacterium]